MRRSLLLALAVVSAAAAGCAGGSSAVPAGALAVAGGAATGEGALETSAFRTVAAVDGSATRSTQALKAIPMPLAAIPMPLAAIPMTGQTPPPVSNVCAAVASTQTSACHAIQRRDVVTNASTNPVVLAGGLQPGWLQLLYGMPAPTVTSGAGRTVAVIVAYDDPNAESDLAVYRSTFGLTPCSTANGCFTKLAQDGTTAYPSADPGWSVETSLDVDTVSAVCPGCNILVVEARSANIPDLATAVDTAAAHGATVISNSYGVPEAADNVQYDAHYNHPGIPVVASAGDQGFGVMFPASSEYVISVGGTALYQSGGGVVEGAWPLTGAGCSAYIPKPAWQKDKGCAKRMLNDIAVLADPATGMAVYDSTLNGTGGGWTVIGGTSMSAPVVASLIAMSAKPSANYTAQNLYTAPGGAYFDVTFGSNGSCAVAYFCMATKDYNGPVGNGTPKGNSAFN